MQACRFQVLHGRGVCHAARVQVKVGDTHVGFVAERFDVQMFVVAAVDLAYRPGDLAEVPPATERGTH
ncbi:hypothetical protein D3C86_1653500 [compost metagenome]